MFKRGDVDCANFSHYKVSTTQFNPPYSDKHRVQVYGSRTPALYSIYVMFGS